MQTLWFLFQNCFFTNNCPFRDVLPTKEDISSPTCARLKTKKIYEACTEKRNQFVDVILSPKRHIFFN